jgi:hypothetical protein
MVTTEAEARLAEFLARFTPEIEARATAIIAAMRRRLPGATIPVYDNYNALAVGFGASDRLRDVVFSIAVFPRWVSLFFARGVGLEDPHGVLKGSGNQVRHIVLAGPEALDDPAVAELMDRALARATPPIDPAAEGRVVIKSVSANQRPRQPEIRPAGSARPRRR